MSHDGPNFLLPFRTRRRCGNAGEYLQLLDSPIRSHCIEMHDLYFASISLGPTDNNVPTHISMPFRMGLEKAPEQIGFVRHACLLSHNVWLPIMGGL